MESRLYDLFASSRPLLYPLVQAANCGGGAETLFGYSFTDDWQTYGDARAQLLQPGYSRDYVVMKFYLSIALFNAMKMGVLLSAFGYVYGAFYTMLAAWATLRRH